MKYGLLISIFCGSICSSTAQFSKLSLGVEVNAGFAASLGGLGGNAGIRGILTYQPLKQIGISAGMGGYFLTHGYSDKDYYRWTQKIDYLAPQLNVIATPFAGVKERSSLREIYGPYLEAGISTLFLMQTRYYEWRGPSFTNPRQHLGPDPGLFENRLLRFHLGIGNLVLGEKWRHQIGMRMSWSHRHHPFYGKYDDPNFFPLGYPMLGFVYSGSRQLIQKKSRREPVSE